jgi:hypothetical protein
MSKWAYAGPHPPMGVFCPAGLTRINIVFSAYRQRDAISRWHDNAGRPDLDIDLVDLPRFERLDLVMGMVRPVRLSQLLIELAMRHAKPSLRDRRMRIQGAPEHDLPEVRAEYANDEKQIGVLRRGRYP